MSRRKALPFTCLTSLSVRVLFLAAISPACFFLPRLPLCRSCFSFIFQPLICGALKNIQFLTAEMFSSKSVWFFCVGLCSNNNNIFVFFFPLFFPPHIYLTLARSHHPATCPSFPPPVLNIKQNPSPLERRTKPGELLLISVRASLSDGSQMSLTSCKQDIGRNTHRSSTQPPVKCGGDLCRYTAPPLPRVLS